MEVGGLAVGGFAEEGRGRGEGLGGEAAGVALSGFEVDEEDEVLEEVLEAAGAVADVGSDFAEGGGVEGGAVFEEDFGEALDAGEGGEDGGGDGGAEVGFEEFEFFAEEAAGLIAFSEASADGVEEGVAVAGFGEVVVGAEVHALAEVVLSGFGGEEEEGDGGEGGVGAEGAEDAVAVEAGHHDVAEDEFGWGGEGGANAGFPVGAEFDEVAFEFEEFAEILADIGIVFDDEDARLGWHSCRRLRFLSVSEAEGKVQVKVREGGKDGERRLIESGCSSAGAVGARAGKGREK